MRRLSTWCRTAVLSGLVMGSAILGMSACGAFNPAFVDLIDQSDTGQFSTIDNAPGHVVVQFVNNAQVDEQLVEYLVNVAGLTLTSAQRRDLRPRVRLRMQVTFTNGIQTIFEFVDGSSILIDPRFDAQAFPDLNQNDLDNSVVICDVSRVEVAPGSAIEVFIPVELDVYELVEVQGPGGETNVAFVLREQQPPIFQVLLPDDVDEDGNVTLQRNIGIRDFPAPALDPLCGSVVTVVMDGVLRVPFLPAGMGEPSFDRDDEVSVAGIGGRYEIRVGVQ